MKLDRFGIARALREIAALLELEGGNPFRARAYGRAAEALEDLRDDLGALVDADALTSIPNVGAALAAQIAELHRTGRSATLERLRAQFPKGAVELVQIAGLSVARVRALHEALGIESVDDLERACRDGRVRAVRGFGAKTEARLLDAIAAHRAREDRVLLIEARPLAERLARFLRESEHAAQVDVAGEIRRHQESVASIDVVASTKDRAALAEHAARWPLARAIESRTDDRLVLRTGSGLRVEVHLVSPPRAHATALLFHTGPREHVTELIRRAEGAPLRGRTEEQIYASVGLAFVPPELREDDAAIARAEQGEIELIEVAQVRGLVHCHTDWSDGVSTLEEMARAADELGMAYLTVTDHSAAAHYARGLDEDRLLRQWDAIAEVQEKVKVRLLRGTEADILQDGALDWPDRILERFDVVIASVHSGFKMEERAMTTRLVRAMRHPCFKIWGHALGRLVERRAPYAVRMEEVLDAVADSRAAIEINGDPYRLDPEPRWIRLARQRGIRFVVSTDAHSTGALRNVELGVAMARRGGLTDEDVLNTRDAATFARLVRPAA